jgi:hypothetical protein
MSGFRKLTSLVWPSDRSFRYTMARARRHANDVRIEEAVTAILTLLRQIRIHYATVSYHT